jgi:hypothetical protein
MALARGYNISPSAMAARGGAVFNHSGRAQYKSAARPINPAGTDND